jgi:hypothetical protein
MTTATPKQQWAALIKLDIRIFHNNNITPKPALVKLDHNNNITPKPALVKLDIIMKDEPHRSLDLLFLEMMLQYFTDDPRRFWCCVYVMLMLCALVGSLARRF